MSARGDLFKKMEYNRRMNIEQRKNLSYRLVAAFLLFISVGLVVFATIKTIQFNYDELVLALVALIFTGVLGMIEAGFILRGWTKESYLYKIAFNDTDYIIFLESEYMNQKSWMLTTGNFAAVPEYTDNDFFNSYCAFNGHYSNGVCLDFLDGLTVYTIVIDGWNGTIGS